MSALFSGKGNLIGEENLIGELMTEVLPMIGVAPGMRLDLGVMIQIGGTKSGVTAPSEHARQGR